MSANATIIHRSIGSEGGFRRVKLNAESVCVSRTNWLLRSE